MLCCIIELNADFQQSYHKNMMDSLSRIGQEFASEAMDRVEFDGDPGAAKHVLVFGSSGADKTSFSNALTGRNLPIGGGTRRVTLQS